MDITLKIDQIVEKYKRYDLVLKMAILGTKNSLSFVTLSNSHPVVSIGQVELGKAFGST